MSCSSHVLLRSVSIIVHKDTRHLAEIIGVYLRPCGCGWVYTHSTVNAQCQQHDEEDNRPH